MNARDWAKKQKNELITAVNGRIVNIPIKAFTLELFKYSILFLPINGPILLEFNISADEFALNHSIKVNPF